MEYARKMPPRGHQVCGYQLWTAHRDGEDRWCVRRKAAGLHHCRDCEDRLLRAEAAGCLRMRAPGSAAGVGMDSRPNAPVIRLALPQPLERTAP